MKNPLFLDIGPYHVNRGGNWYDDACFMRVFYRFGNDAFGRIDLQGFRLFRTQEKK